jgi:hypothetical protein
MVYKVVTHTIKEEHFDHPLALAAINGVKLNGDYANSNGNYNGNPNGNSNGSVVTETAIFVPGTMSIFNTDSAIEFRMAARTIFARYLWRLRSYIVSALDGSEDLAVVEEQLFQNIDEIGDSVRPYYGLVASKQLSQLMRAMVLTELDIVQTLKKNQPIDQLQQEFKTQVVEFAAFLESANPKNWPADVVIKIFGRIVDSWIEEARARISKNWPADIEAVDTAHRIMLAGQDDGTPAFSDIFAKGIIMQFPDRFTGESK